MQKVIDIVWRTSLLAWVIFALATAVVAQPPLTITDAGYYITVVGDDGVPSMQRLTNVTDLRDGPSTPVPPQTPDKPPELSPPPAGISSDAAKWSSETGDMAGAQRYAIVLETVRDGAKDGKVDQENLFRVLKAAGDVYLDANWDTFRRKLGDHLTSALQDGAFTSDVKIANAIERIRYGVGYSARDSESIPASEAVDVIAQVNAIIRKEDGS